MSRRHRAEKRDIIPDPKFGDVVLKAAGQRLRSAVRDTDVVGRWGGDEFVVVVVGEVDRGREPAGEAGIGRHELGHLGRREIAALVGVAPFARDSGTFRA